MRCGEIWAENVAPAPNTKGRNHWRQGAVAMISKKIIVQALTMQSVCREQGCINCGILVSEIQARGVSSEHMENMEMFSCSPT